jgi:GNAT superfamily N-acetyltransferase
LRFRIAFAGPKDLDLLVSHRLKMWGDIHPEWKGALRGSEEFTKAWIKEKLSEGKLVGFIARAPDGTVAGSGCVWIREEQPRPTNPSLEVPYLMSMYTEREFRRKGVAGEVVMSAVKWCRAHKYQRIVLHASEEGRPLYESLGFEPGSEMRLKL